MADPRLGATAPATPPRDTPYMVNAWLELQWYFYAAVYMLAAAYLTKRARTHRFDQLTVKCVDP